MRDAITRNAKLLWSGIGYGIVKRRQLRQPQFENHIRIFVLNRGTFSRKGRAGAESPFNIQFVRVAVENNRGPGWTNHQLAPANLEWCSLNALAHFPHTILSLRFAGPRA
jgi:hypothetical protein